MFSLQFLVGLFPRANDFATPTLPCILKDVKALLKFLLEPVVTRGSADAFLSCPKAA